MLRFDSERIAAMIIDELRNMEKEFKQVRQKLEDACANLSPKSSTLFFSKRSILTFPWAK